MSSEFQRSIITTVFRSLNPGWCFGRTLVTMYYHDKHCFASSQHCIEIWATTGYFKLQHIYCLDSVQWLRVSNDYKYSVTTIIQWLKVSSDWQCSVTHSIQWLTVSSDWQYSLTDSVQWLTVFSDWQCPVTTSIQWLPLSSYEQYLVTHSNHWLKKTSDWQ